MVITNAAYDNDQVEGLVFVNALVPEEGETAMGLTAMFPGSTLASAFAAPVVLPDGSRDLTIRPDVFRAQFAADVPEPATKLMAVTQRPITQAAFGDPSGEPAWKTIPSWFVYGGLDKNIPPALHAFMAERAHSEKTVIIADGSHVVMVSHPAEVAALIVEAAGQNRDRRIQARTSRIRAFPSSWNRNPCPTSHHRPGVPSKVSPAPVVTTVPSGPNPIDTRSAVWRWTSPRPSELASTSWSTLPPL